MFPCAGSFRPMRCLSNVLLPEPLPPMMMNTSPWLMVKFKSRINTKLPYAIVRLLTVMWALPLLPFDGVPATSISPTANFFSVLLRETILKHHPHLQSSPFENCVVIRGTSWCHAEQSEASRIFRVLRRRDSSASPQNDI